MLHAGDADCNPAISSRHHISVRVRHVRRDARKLIRVSSPPAKNISLSFFRKM
jgi:hypothetical protein